MSLKINENRLLKNLAEIAQIGATADGGVHRIAFSETDLAGRAWFANKASTAGLIVSTDGAGNQTAEWRPGHKEQKKILVGSHLDTVPNGGRFDGALGVLSALEAIQTIQEAHLDLPFNLEIINFTDEEGTILGEFGSQAFVGSLTRSQLQAPRGGRSLLEAGMTRLGLTDESCLSCQRQLEEYVAFVELHIEQGTRLENAGTNIGVVDSIVGIRSFWLTFNGEAAHAGTKPMAERRDAFWGATSFAQTARELVLGRFSPGVVNCGLIELQPAAFNIVPAVARMALEFRHGSEKTLDQMESALLTLARQAAAFHDLDIEIQAVDKIPAAPSNEKIMLAIETAADQLDLSHSRLLSFAGHDTQAVSPFLPSAMIFVPSVAGISHNPHELTKPQDCVNGANVVLHTLLNLASGSLE
jgi:N-carbamoyl-L-amino-acid hydrolase